MSEWSILYIERSQVLLSQTIAFLSLNIFCFKANCADTDEMPHFIWVFTVCHSTRLEGGGGGSSPQSVRAIKWTSTILTLSRKINVFRICNHVRLNLVCSAAETSYDMGIMQVASLLYTPVNE